MTLERFLEIVNNKEYKELEYYEAATMIDDPYIKIYTRNGAFIKFYYGIYSKGLFKPFAKYCMIVFFVPEKDRAVASYDIDQDDDRFKMYKELFFELKTQIDNAQAEKYF